MDRVAFFEVAPYERPVLKTGVPGAELQLHAERLDATSAARAAGARVVSVFVNSRVGPEVLDALPEVRLIATRSTGFDHVDLAACRARGIAVSYVPSYGENTVAEHAFALVFALTRRLGVALDQTRRLDFSLTGLEGLDLLGKTFGVIGAGRIGRHAIRIARGLGMRATAFDPFPRPDVAAEGFEYLPLDRVLAQSDVVSIHAALTPDTRHLIDREALARMRSDAILVNTARGPIVDTEALLEALEAGRLFGAGLDVVEGEELLKARHSDLDPAARRMLEVVETLARRPDVVLTPHSAFFTREGVARLLETNRQNIVGFLAGHPSNLVPGP